jgi:hypothetical protein
MLKAIHHGSIPMYVDEYLVREVLHYWKWRRLVFDDYLDYMDVVFDGYVGDEDGNGNENEARYFLYIDERIATVDRGFVKQDEHIPPRRESLLGEPPISCMYFTWTISSADAYVRQPLDIPNALNWKKTARLVWQRNVNLGEDSMWAGNE